MAGFRLLGVRNAGVAGELIQPGDTALGGENILAGAIATAGDGAWTAQAMVSGFINRTGPGGAYTDTSATSADIITALGGGSGANADVVAGSSFRLIVRNTVAFALTFAAGTGVVVGTGTLNIAASLVREYLVTVLNASPPATIQCVTTNASKVVTFVLPTNQSALQIGPSPQAINLTAGMSVSGTGIAASTKIDGVTQGQGGITGVHLDTNATATSAAAGVALTFNPTVQIDGIRTSTL